MSNIIGIDAGTTHCKAIVVNKAGQILFSAKKNCTSYTDATGMHEQDADEIFALVAGLLTEALTQVNPHTVACISFSTAMHSLLAVDAQGAPLMRALTWADTRAGQYAATLKNLPQAAAIFAETGVPVHAMTPYCKLAWLKQQRPDVFNRAHKFITLKEYILYKLGGQFVVDEAIASATGLMNLATSQWSQAAMQAVGITAQRLPTIVPASYQQQVTLPGLAQNVPFIAGCGDGAAAQLGSGALLPNEACFTIGTSGAVRTFIHQPVTDALQRIFTYAFLPGWYFTGGATNNGGSVLPWFANLFLQGTPQEESFDKIIALAQSSPAGAKGILFVPYLNGERAPVWDAAATARLTGIKSSHQLADYARAAAEGVLLNMYNIFQSLPNWDEVDTIYANGGFFNSPFAAQLLANITGRKVLLQKDADTSAMGAAYVGMLALGWLKEVAEVKQFIATSETYLPEPAIHEIYKEVFERYRREAV